MANERSSGTAFFSSKDEKSVLAGAHDYFVNNVLPSDIKASPSGRFTATAISRTRGRRLRSPRAA